MSIKIGISGITGRVGALIYEEIKENHPDITVSAGLARHAQEISCPLFTPDRLMEFCRESQCIIDFSSPDIFPGLLESARETKTPLVSGTTGLSQKDFKNLKDKSELIPVIYAANMSLGVNLLQTLIRETAGALGENWDIEINEIHHKFKKDAPSGTALALGEAAAQGRKKKLADIAVYDRHDQSSQRKDGEIGFSVQRGGDVAGEHRIVFYGMGERIELAHIATDRALFAKGAIKAARWITDKPGGLYSMSDVLDLKE